LSAAAYATTQPIRLTQVMPAGYLSMFVLGAAMTLYGPTLIYLAAETGQSVATLGWLFVLHWFGFFASTLTANRLARRLEMRRAVVCGGLLVGAGALGLAALPFPFNIASTLLLGFGAGTLEILLNRLVELLAEAEPAAALTRLHATWGLGAISIPLVVAGAVWLGWNWRVAGAVVVGGALVASAAAVRWPEFAVDHVAQISWAG
jgi:MFS family permease